MEARGFLAAGITLVALAVSVPGAFADTIAVTTQEDELGPAAESGAGCSLREAVEAANTDSSFGGCAHSGAGADTISVQFSEPGIGGDAEDLNQAGDLDVVGDLTITGVPLMPFPGYGGVIQANGVDRVFDVLPGASLSLDELVITGGGIRVAPTASLVYEDGHVGRAGFGGALGGLSNDGRATLKRVGFTNGSPVLNQGILEMDRVLVAHADLGAALTNEGVATVNSSTFTRSRPVWAPAGGVVNLAGGVLTLSNSIVAQNALPDWDPADEPYVQYKPADCSGVIVSGGNNLIGSLDGCTGYVASPTDLTGQDPGFPIEDWYPDDYRPPQDSPAVDAGSLLPVASAPTACSFQDIEGKPLIGRCDIGAYEWAPPTDASPSLGGAVRREPRKCRKGPRKRVKTKLKRCGKRRR